MKKFSEQLGKPISESTVRDFKKAYCSALSKTKSEEPVTRLEHGLRGRPLLLGDLDSKVQQYVRKLRLAGGIVNRAIVIAALCWENYQMPPCSRLPSRLGCVALPKSLEHRTNHDSVH